MLKIQQIGTFQSSEIKPTDCHACIFTWLLEEADFSNFIAKLLSPSKGAASWICSAGPAGSGASRGLDAKPCPGASSPRLVCWWACAWCSTTVAGSVLGSLVGLLIPGWAPASLRGMGECQAVWTRRRGVCKTFYPQGRNLIQSTLWLLPPLTDLLIIALNAGRKKIHSGSRAC